MTEGFFLLWTHTPQPHPWTLRRKESGFKSGDTLHFRLPVHRDNPSMSMFLDLGPRLLCVESCNGPLDQWTHGVWIQKMQTCYYLKK